MTIYAVYFAEPINSKPFIQLKKNTTEYSWKNIEQSSKFDIKGIFGGGVGLRMKSHRIKSCNASLLMLWLCISNKPMKRCQTRGMGEMKWPLSNSRTEMFEPYLIS